MVDEEDDAGGDESVGGFGFISKHHGIIGRDQMAALFASSHIFIDMSSWQAFGKAGLEAMAVGCVPIVPSAGGVREYAADRANAMVVDTSTAGPAVDAVDELIADDGALWAQMRAAALRSAAGFSIERAAADLAAHLERALLPVVAAAQ